MFYAMLTATIFTVCSLFAAAARGDAPTATVDSGVLIGTTTLLPTATACINKFLGVPFAVSPPGRFVPPVREQPFGERNATTYSAACVQEITNVVTQDVFNNPAPKESEDCLYLNVYAPSTPVHPDNKRSVLFWIYGGSLQFGNAVFGFPIAPNQPVNARNLGFLDQRAGLDWVQRNIHAFGGDPNKVTIFGESAGAFSVDALLTSYPRTVSPPFRGAILESGQYAYRQPAPADPYGAWTFLTKALNCSSNYENDLDCVKAASVDQIRGIVSNNSLAFNPVVDNVTLVQNPAAERRAGNIARVPVLAGTNAQEGRIFELGQNNVTSFINATITQDPSAIAQIAALYPVGPGGFASAYDAISQIFTEYFFQCPQAAMTNDSAVTKIPTWRYYFNATFVNTQGLQGLGAYHSSEIPIVFRTYSVTATQAYTTTQEYALAQYMQHTWARFAKNPQGGPGWNAVDVGVPATILAGANVNTTGGLYLDANSQRTSGTYNLAVLGSVRNVMSSGATIVPQESLDYRCVLYEAAYNAIRNSPSGP
ncbi:alpha/beta-hydrolase [Myriangium duriaei CBS 260.36]|uniref:Carboxylic ester hydrolase n=1 Tax=Myriangium duriaei CBS 260.36 TaxID=1168546 RepID=A0A9P4IY23_9PEZI|nr:alpha/beta-hydrolase [Myriangium duriaei CBS 260.36]